MSDEVTPHDFLLNRVSAIQGRQTQYLTELKEMTDKLTSDPSVTNDPNFLARIAQVTTFMSMNQGGTNLLLNLREAGFQLINPENEEKMLEQISQQATQVDMEVAKRIKNAVAQQSKTQADLMLERLKEQSEAANEQLKALNNGDNPLQ